MADVGSKAQTLFQELQRRRVFRVAAFYGGITFVIIQIIDGTFEVMGIPAWVSRLLIILIALGFPVSMILAWVFDITEKGVVRTPSKEAAADVMGSPPIIIGNRILALVAALAIAIAAWSWLGWPSVTRPITSIAVLPLDNLMNDPEQDYFVAGMHEALITELSRISALTVISRNSAIYYRDKHIRTPEIARQLNVDAIVEGSVFKADGQVRITAQLIDGRTDKHLWANDYSRALTDIIALQKSIASAIAKEIEVTLTPEEEARLASTRPVDPEAYEFYLRGKYRWQKRQNQEDIEIARGYLVRAFELDKNLLSAKLHLGQSYRETGEFERAMAIFQECLEQSERIGDRFSEAMSFRNMGNIYLSRGYYDKAIEHYEQSLLIARSLGDKLNEQSTLRNMGSAYFSKDDIEPAIKYYKESLEIASRLDHRRGEGDALHNLGSVYQEIGDYERAIDSYSRALGIFQELGEKSPESSSLIGIGLLYAKKANYDAALSYFQKSLELAREITDRRSELYSLINIGEVYNQINEIDQALEYYQQSLSFARYMGDRYIEGVSSTKVGELMVEKEEYAQSIQHFASGCKIWKEPQNLSHYVWTLSWWSLSELKFGNVEGALNKAVEVETIMAETQPYEDYVITVNWNLSQVYTGLGEPVKAEAYLQTAYEEVMSRAGRFKDSNDRKAFLNNISENHDVISAYGQLSEPSG